MAGGRMRAFKFHEDILWLTEKLHLTI